MFTRKVKVKDDGAFEVQLRDKSYDFDMTLTYEVGSGSRPASVHAKLTMEHAKELRDTLDRAIKIQELTVEQRKAAEEAAAKVNAEFAVRIRALEESK